MIFKNNFLNKMTGYLDITFGPMFSGKTSNLVEKINNYIVFKSIEGKNIKGLIINSSLDNRDINKIENLTTHNQFIKDFKLPSNIESMSCKTLMPFSEKIDDYDYIAIDESQFFEDLEPFVKTMLKKGKYIHCVGLIADSEKNTFGQMHKIFAMADNITQLKAFCVKCKSWHKNASFTKWISNEDKNQAICVSGKDKYVPVCGKHY